MTATPTVPRRHPVMAFAADMPALQNAACRYMDPELWFPADSDLAGIGQAKAICRQQCPVLIECREWALSHAKHTAYGIWAGMTPDERKRERKRRESAAYRRRKKVRV